MFDELDGVPWASMKHAYGSAEDVPELLRGLVSDDEDEREIALDRFYGAVHHQGDVYDSTRAAIPFLLEIVAAGGVPGRGEVLELLGSIGGSGNAMATAAVTEAVPVFLGLIADPDPGVRGGTVKALAACGSHASEVVPALKERLKDEPDAAIRQELVQVGAELDRDTGRLAGIVTGPLDPATRLTALTALTQMRAPAGDAQTALGGHTLPAEGAALHGRAAGLALGMIDELVAAAGPPPSRDERPATPTLIGKVRAAMAEEDAGRRVPELNGLVHRLGAALGDRRAERVELVEGLLRAPDWERRADGLHAAGALTRQLRGPYGDVVELVGRQLADPEPRVVGGAVRVLKDLFGLAAPAADDLAAFLESAPRVQQGEDRHEGWITVCPKGWPHTGGALTALARAGDARALPMLRWALELDEPPEDIGHVLRSLGEGAAELVPLIRQRLRDLPEPPGFRGPRSGLVAALGDLGPAAAPAVPEVLDALRRDPARGAYHALRGLSAAGVPLGPAVPALRELLGDERKRVGAAYTLWAIEGDAEAVLPVLLDAADDEPTRVVTVAEFDPAAGKASIGRLRELMVSDDPQTGSEWTRLRAGKALWRLEGEVEDVLPVLRAAWDANPHVRDSVAGVLGEMGAAAHDAADLLTDELNRPWRHNLGPEGYSRSSHDIPDDEKLLDACRSALRKIGG